MNSKLAIVTGFDPFGGFKFNPTGDLALQLNGKEIEGIQVMGLVLPTSYARCALPLQEAIIRYRPERVISFGLAEYCYWTTLERFGRNVTNYPDPDNDGELLKGGKIDPNGPDKVEIADVLEWQTALDNTGVPSNISTNADSFVCNNLAYKMPRWMRRKRLKTKFVFIHLPWPEDYREKASLGEHIRTIPRYRVDQVVSTLLTSRRG